VSEEFEVESKIEVPESAGAGAAHTPWLISAIAITTAALAVLAAYSSFLAGEAAHHSLAELNRAAILQNQASDQWNFYQAEGIKRHTFEVQRDVGRLTPDRPHAALAARHDAEARRYAKQQADIMREAKGFEHQRDEAVAASQQLDARYQQLGQAVGFFQTGIVVSSVAAIIRRRGLWYLGLLGGAAGAAMLLRALATPVAG